MSQQFDDCSDIPSRRNTSRLSGLRGERNELHNTGTEGMMDDNLDSYFHEITSVTAPVLPVQTLLISFHIMQKRARQLIDDTRFFTFQQVTWFFMSLLMLTLPKRVESSLRVLGEIVLAVVLAISTMEIALYIVGHGFFSGRRFGRDSQQLKIASVLHVWSPPRFRRREGVSAVGSYHLQIPLLAHPFYRIELVLVLLSLVGYTLHIDTFGRMRYLHGLRSMRLLYGMCVVIPSMRRFVVTFQTSFGALSTSMILLAFFMTLFGIAGLDQFQRTLSQNCVALDEWQPFHSYNRSDICGGSGGNWNATSSSSSTSSTAACVSADPKLYCDIAAEAPSLTSPFVCRGHMVCRVMQAPNYDYTSFDDFLRTCLLVIQVTSLTDWGEFLRGLWASNARFVVGIYLMLIIIIGYYIILNFVVAIMCSAFGENRQTRKGSIGGKVQSMSVLNFRLSEFVWWKISTDAQYYLSYSASKTKRLPFYRHRIYRIARDVWMLLVVASHAANSANASSGLLSYLHVLEIMNLVGYSMDILVSIVASGSLGKYLIETAHRYDLFTYLLTVLGVAIGIPLSVFRFPLVGQWLEYVPVVRKSNVLRLAIVAAPGTLTVALIMLLFLFVSSAVAVQLFSRESVATDWDDSWNAVVTLFRFVTLDGWATIMYDAMSRNFVVGLGFFLPTYILFGYVIRALFTAVVVDAFDPKHEDKMKWQLRAHRTKGNDEEDEDEENDHDDPNARNPYDVGEEERQVLDKSFFYFDVSNRLRKLLLQLVTIPSDLELPRGVVLEEDQEIDALVPYRCYGSYFQFVVILFVLLSVVTAADPPSEACSALLDRIAVSPQYVITQMTWIDGVIAGIFTAEMLLKMIALGVTTKGDDRPWYFGEPYVRDWWNLLDLTLLATMFISFVYPQVSVLRLMRILRPLRIVRRFRRMRLVMQGVIKSISGVVVTLLCAAVLLFLFAVVGVARFRGQMHSCNVAEIGDVVVKTKSDCVGMFISPNGVLVHADWQPASSNFDTVVDGMSYLMRIVGLNSWTDLLAQATSVTGVDKQPRPKAQLQNSLYFFIFAILANNFIISIIIGCIVVAFDEQRGLLYLTLQQRMFKSLQDQIERLSPIPPPPVTRFPLLLRIVRSNHFDYFLNFVVFFNVVVLMVTHASQSDEFTNIQFYLNAVFTFIFIAEAALKILALGKHYIRDAWNVVDCLIVVGSTLEFSLQLAASNQSVTITSVGRAFRILRVFRTVRRIPSLQNIFVALLTSVPAILSVFVIIILIVFMYSVFGMQLLGQLRFQANISNDANFRDYITAFFTVFRMLTLDGWDHMMQDASAFSGESCSSKQSGWWYLDWETGAPTDCGILDDCGGVVSARAYFFSFYIISAFIFSNIVVALLLDSFKLNSSSARALVRLQDITAFQDSWLRVRRVLGEESFYGTFVEKELMSLLVISLFRDNNGLALSRDSADKHIHPVLTSRSRMNFRKLIFELDYISDRRREQLLKKFRKLHVSRQPASSDAQLVAPPTAAAAADSVAGEEVPSTGGSPTSPAALHKRFGHDGSNNVCDLQTLYPPGKYEFHDVLDCMCRFQMGQDALTLAQKEVRRTFEDRMDAALLSRSVRQGISNWLNRAREQLRLYSVGDDPRSLLTSTQIGSLEKVARWRQDGDQVLGDNGNGGVASSASGDGSQHDHESPMAEGARHAVRDGEHIPRETEASPLIELAPPAGIDDPHQLLPTSSSITVDGRLAATRAGPGWRPVALAAAAVDRVLSAEATQRRSVVLSWYAALQLLIRQFIEATESLLWATLLADCKREWVLLLLHLRSTVSLRRAAVSNSRVTPPTYVERGPAAEPPVRNLSQARSNPLRYFDAEGSGGSGKLPTEMCPLGDKCPDYDDTLHSREAMHPCRDGMRCTNRSADHLARYSHRGQSLAARSLRLGNPRATDMDTFRW